MGSRGTVVSQAHEEIQLDVRVFKVKKDLGRGDPQERPAYQLGNAGEGELAGDSALAAAVHPVVDNPYFDSDLLRENEFFGFLEGDVILSIGSYSRFPLSQRTRQ